MTKTFSAIFENGVFRPLEPIDFPEHCHVRVEVQSAEPANRVASVDAADTPTHVPQRVRLVGRLAKLCADTRTFELALDDGWHVASVLVAGDVSGIVPLLNQRVLVLGTAIYRSSGDLARVDVDEVGATSDEGDFFSAIPRPIPEHVDLDEVSRDDNQRRGISAIMGQWPGDETDEEIAAALKELS